MMVVYLANGDVREISEAAARQLIGAGICYTAEEPKKDAPKKEPKKSDKPTKVEPMTTEDFPVPTKQVS
jgi:hypothetical protein